MPRDIPIGKTMRAAAFFAVICVAGLLVAVAYQKGRESTLAARRSGLEAAASFRVDGPSMFPSFMGPSLSVSCGECKSSCQVDPAFATTPDRNRVCPFCGGRLVADDPDVGVDASLMEGDVVDVEQIDFVNEASLQIGDIVALKTDGLMRLKRVAGIGGDTISVDGGRLKVNGRRLEDLLYETKRSPRPQLLVDRDNRVKSRWSPHVTGSGWERLEASKSWRWKASELAEGKLQENWLVYHHENVHDQNMPSRVYDDYHLNVATSRQMNPVDRLAVSAAVLSSADFTVRVLFWTPDGVYAATRDLSGECNMRINYYDAAPEESLVVSAKSPIAIRFQDVTPGTSLELSQLWVSRFNEYRLRRVDDASVYPLQLGDGECFVVGDNVPVSIDSRSTGPVSYRQLYGRLVE